jgi:hypothetical protein
MKLSQSEQLIRQQVWAIAFASHVKGMPYWQAENIANGSLRRYDQKFKRLRNRVR